MKDLKSLWKERHSEPWSFFCPNCKSSRRIPFRPRPGTLKHIVQLGISTVFLTLLTWKWFAWKGIVLFFPLWAAFEVIYRGRLRAALACPYCGFDPYLYVTDVQKARKEVVEYWKKKKESEEKLSEQKRQLQVKPPEKTQEKRA